MYKQVVTSVTDSIAQTLMLNSKGSHACNNKYTHSSTVSLKKNQGYHNAVCSGPVVLFGSSYMKLF